MMSRTAVFFSSRRSSVISSSLNVTTSRMLARSFLSLSPSDRISCTTSGERESAFRTTFWPCSIRLAISTSPSRLSSGTVPISRRYMRTGSLVLSSVMAREIELAFFPGVSPRLFVFLALVLELLLGIDHLDAGGSEQGKDAVELVRGADSFGEQVVDLVIEQVTPLLSHQDQLFDFIVLFFDRQNRCLLSCYFLDRLTNSRSTRTRCSMSRFSVSSSFR